jgi:hypothetical protein
MQSKAPKSKRRAKAYSWLLLPLAILATAPIGWSIFWYVKSRQTAAAVAAWMTNEAQRGRIWSCPSQTIRGFPFSVTISCENMLYQGDVLGMVLTGTLRGLHATAPLLRNDNVLAKLDPPFTAKNGDGTLDISLQWSELFVELDGGPGVLGRFALMGNQVRLRGRAGETDAQGTFGDVTSYFAISPGRRDEAYDILFSFHQGSVPALSSLLDTQLPIALHLEGTVSQVAPGGAATLPDFLENWRAAHGHLDVTIASLTSGPVGFSAKGGLGIDNEHRLQGKLDASFAGLEQGFRQLGIDPALLTAGQALSGLLGGGQGDGRLSLPVTFSEGFLSIGPIRTSIQIPPLY